MMCVFYINGITQMQCIKNSLRIPQPNPNTFAGLMELYENNYIKLKKLCGNFNVLDEKISVIY